jgi:hypothetical protein
VKDWQPTPIRGAIPVLVGCLFVGLVNSCLTCAMKILVRGAW